MKRKNIVVLAVLLSLFSCSCKGYRESDSEYFISAVGFGKTQSGYCSYMEVLSLSSNKNNSEGKLFKSEGATPFEAINNTSSLLSRAPVFDHCTTALIDSNIKGETLKEVLDYLYETKNLNLGIYIFVTEDIKKVLSSKSEAIGIGYDIMSIELNLYQSTGVRAKNKYFEIESRKGDFCVPQVSVNEDRPRIEGYTVYKNYYPTLNLSNNEGIFLELAAGGSNGGEINVFGKKCRIISAYSKIEKQDDTLKIGIGIRYKRQSDVLNREIKGCVATVLEKIRAANALDVLGFKGINEINKVEVTGK